MAGWSGPATHLDCRRCCKVRTRRDRPNGGEVVRHWRSRRVATPMPITFFDHTAPSLDANLALDEALLLAAEAGDGGEVLRFWEWPAHAVVLGAGALVGIDVNVAACREEGVTMHRRASGGGTVLVGRGCLLFSLVLAYDRAAELRDVTASYRWILGRPAGRPAAGRPAGACRHQRPGVGRPQGVRERPAAQGPVRAAPRDAAPWLRPGGGGLLSEPAGCAASLPGRRPHGDFVVNLPADAETLKRLLIAAFDAEPGKWQI